MKKIKFNTYTDGSVEFGKYIETYDEEGNALEKKEFSKEGKLFFSYKTIREQDRLKFDNTGEKISIKIKTPYFKGVNSSHVVKLNNELFNILYIEPDLNKRNLYIYLTELKDELNRHIEILKQYRKSALENKTLESFKIVWAKVEEIINNSKVETDADRIKQRKKVTIRYLKELDININPKAIIDFRIKYKENFYNINQIVNVDDLNELLELSIERIY